MIALKSQLLDDAPYADDVKSIAGELFNAMKREWRLKQPGLNRHMFMRDVCAPLITPETETYTAIAIDLGIGQPE